MEQKTLKETNKKYIPPKNLERAEADQNDLKIDTYKEQKYFRHRAK
jgi:hypothetical protein